MDNHEDLLARIEEFLSRQLANETLSGSAEKIRLDLLTPLRALNLPPALPRRDNEQHLSNGGRQKSQDDFFAEQRAYSREAASLAPHEPLADGGTRVSEVYDIVKDLDRLVPVATVKNGQAGEDEDDDGVVEEDDGLYEVPVETAVIAMPTTSSGGAAALSATDDYSSGTSYESYDDDEEYDDINIDPPSNGNYIALPRVKSKQKSPPRDPATCGDDLSGSRHSGHLLQRRAVLGWSRRWGVLCGTQLYLFKSQPPAAAAGGGGGRGAEPLGRGAKAAACMSVEGRDALYVGREGRCAHAIRLTRPGDETQWLGADTQDEARIWVKHMSESSGKVGGPLLSASSTPPADASTPLDHTDHNSLDYNDSKESTSQTDISLFSSSEGSSADGVVTAQSAAKRDEPPAAAAGTKRTESRKFLPTFFVSLGKKRGEKAKRLVQTSCVDADASMPDVAIYGYVNIASGQLAGGARRWHRMWCVVRHATLECHKARPAAGAAAGGSGEAPPPELSLDLAGRRVEGSDDKKHELALKLVADGGGNGGELLLLEAENKIDHGLWLGALVKRTASVRGSGDAPCSADRIYENDPSFLPEDNADGGDGDYGDGDDVYDEIEVSQRPVGNVTAGKIKEKDVPPVMTCDDSVPPPLPKKPPPTNRPIKRTRSLRRSNSDVTQQVTKNDVLNFEAEMSAKFAEIESQFRVSETPGGEGDAPLVAGAVDGASPGQAGVAGVARHKDRSNSLDGDVDSGVVKGHSGRTIDGDKEILSTAANPILSELRNSRHLPRSQATKTQERLTKLEVKATELRRESGELGRKKTAATTRAQGLILEQQLNTVDKELELVDAQVVRLRLITHEKSASVRRDNSFSSDSSRSSAPPSAPPSRSNSFKTIGAPTAKVNIKVTHVKSPATTRTTAAAAATAAGRGAPRRSKKEAADVISKCLPGGGRRGGGGGAAAATCVAAQRVRSSATSTSTTTRNAIARWNTDDATTVVSRTTVTTTTRGNPAAAVAAASRPDGGDGGGEEGGARKSNVWQRLQQWESLAEDGSDC